MCSVQSRQPSKFVIPRQFLTAMWGIVVTCISATGPADGADADFHYLAADPSLRAGMQNTDVVMGTATYYGQVLANDQPWEAPYVIHGSSVVTDPVTKQLRMYYQLYNPQDQREIFTAMATSSDGIHWNKPALNITGTMYTNDPLNNFVKFPQQYMANSCVFVDPTAPAGSPRYLMGALIQETWTLYSLSSSDGKTWNYTGGTLGNSIIDDWHSSLALDTSNVTLWDPMTQKYTLYGRYWYDGWRRGVYLKQSDTWDGAWAGERQFILDPQDVVPPGGTPFDIYAPSIQTYHGQYVGLPALYFHPDGTSGPVYPTFMYSRDGKQFSFDDPYHSIIDLSAHDQNEQTFGQAYPQATMVERDDLLYIYYQYFSGNHDGTEEQQNKLCLATLPVDRFVGIQSSPGSVGVWTTSAITLSDDPGHLVLNAQIDGSVQVEVLDPATGEPLVGYGAADAILLSPGDFLDATVQWNSIDNLNGLAGQTVALRFLMDDATVYGFHFATAPEPGAIVLLATGLIGLLAFAWHNRKDMS